MNEIPQKVREISARYNGPVPAEISKMYPLPDDEMNAIWVFGSYFDANVTLRVSDSRAVLTKRNAIAYSDFLRFEYGDPVVLKEASFPQFSQAVLEKVQVGTTIKDRATIKRLHDFLFDAGEFSNSDTKKN